MPHKKQCVSCKEHKLLTEFNKQKTGLHGRRSNCKTCQSKYYRDYFLINKDKINLKNRAYNAANKDKLRLANRKYKAANKDKIRAYGKLYASEHTSEIAIRKRRNYNTNKQEHQERTRRYSSLNRDKVNARTARRRARKLHATPVWADVKTCARFYKYAQLLTIRTGEQYHVDHIIPLTNDKVCGLHCEFNLQVITATENLSKNNSFIV